MARAVKKQKEQFENAVRKSSRHRYSLRLYVTGMTPRSTRAIKNITEICEAYLKGRYELDIIDIYRQTKLTKDDEIIVAPTLIKKMPLPLKRLIGDMTSTDKVLLALDLRPEKEKLPKKHEQR